MIVSDAESANDPAPSISYGKSRVAETDGLGVNVDTVTAVASTVCRWKIDEKR